MFATDPPPTDAPPLSGVRVLDLTQHLAGPFATQILGDLGADVIKIEPPDGDGTRGIGPYYLSGRSAYYTSVNRNKRSVVLDLKSPAGHAVLNKLIDSADVLIENYRPGALERLGISVEELRQSHPDLVICSISGFGQDGPLRDLPAFDMVVQALSGGMSITGEIGGRPVRSGLPIGDLAAGMNAVIGVLAALAKRSAGRQGSVIDVSMLDTQVSLLSYVATYVLAGSDDPGPQGRQHMSIPTYRALSCGDGRDIVITANTQRMWHGLCRALRLDIADDERFATREARRQNAAELSPVLEAAAATRQSAELVDTLRAEGVPAAPIQTVQQVLRDPHILHRGMVVEMNSPDGPVPGLGNPIKFTGTTTPIVAPPQLGDDTVRVLTDVAGLTADEIRDLQAEGVFGRVAATVGADEWA